MSVDDQFALQKAVKRRIIDERLTQRSLCEKLGVGVSSLSRWLNGLTAKMHPENKAQLDDMARAWLAGQKPNRLDKKKLCGKGRKRCPSCSSIVRSNAVTCSTCNHSFAELEDAKKRQQAIKWSDDLTTKSDRSARASVAKRRKRSMQGDSQTDQANPSKSKRRKKRESKEPSKKRQNMAKRKDENSEQHADEHKQKRVFRRDQSNSGFDDYEPDSLVNYNLLESFPEDQLAPGGHALNPTPAIIEPSVPPEMIEGFQQHNVEDAEKPESPLGSRVADPSFAYIPEVDDDRDQGFLTYLTTSALSSRASPIPVSLDKSDLSPTSMGSSIHASVHKASSLDSSPLAAGDFIASSLGHASLLSDILSVVSPTNCSPNASSHHPILHSNYSFESKTNSGSYPKGKGTPPTSASKLHTAMEVGNSDESQQTLLAKQTKTFLASNDICV